MIGRVAIDFTQAPLPPAWNLCRVAQLLERQRFAVGKVKRSDYAASGNLPIIDQGQELIAGYWNDYQAAYDGPLPVIVFGDHTRAVKFIDFPFVCGADGTKVLIPKRDTIDPEFLYHALQALDLPSRGYNRHFQILKERRLPVPPIPEQQAIAHVLHLVQRTKDATEQVIAAARDLKKSLVRHLFNASWPLERLGDLIEPPQYGYTASANAERIGPRFLRITDIQDGNVRWESVPFCDCDEMNVTKHALRAGDVVVARIGATTGKALYLAEVPEPTVFASYLIRLRPQSERQLHARYLGYFTEAAAYWDQINAEKGGRLKTGVNAKVLSELRVPLPSMQDQLILVERLEAIDRKITSEQALRDAIAILFDALLHDLMTARRRVTSLEVRE